MKAKNKIQKILACIALLVAMIASCTFQPLFVMSEYLSQASAKSYASEKKTEPYEFESSGQWSINSNYSGNAFDKTVVSQNLARLTFEEGSSKVKPATLWNGDTTSPSDDLDNNKYKVLMMDATNADIKQDKDEKDDDGNVVYKKDAEGNFIFETEEVEGTTKTKYYEASSINTSDKKYVPADEATDGAENVGKYKAKVVNKVPTDIYYYYKSNSISFSKQSYYVMSFWVYTSGDAYASVRVANSAETFNAKVENIQTSNEWKKVYLFMETRADGSASSVYISLFFGSTESINGLNSGNTQVSGTVYFDTVELKTINYTDYVNQTIDGTSPSESNHEIADNYTNRYAYDLLGNTHFDSFDAETKNPNLWTNYIPEYTDGSTDDKISETTKAKYNEAYSKYSKIEVVSEAEELKNYDLDEEGNKKYAPEDTEKENPLMVNGYSTFKADNKILKIDNDSQLFSIGKTSEKFTVGQFKYYRVSLWVKAADEDSSATVIVYGKVITGNKSEGLLVSQKQTLTDIYHDLDQVIKADNDENDKSDMEYNNGWTEVVFYVHGNAYSDLDIQIALLADKNSTVYFDNIVIENILSTEYSSATSSKKLELTHTPSKGSSEQNISTSITNGYFDNITTEKFDYNDDENEYEPYSAPYKAASWTLGKDNSKDVVAGIIPTGSNYNNEIGNKLGGTNANPLENPNTQNYPNGVKPASNNVYAIYAPKTNDEGEETTHNYAITSSSFSLSSNSVYKVSFMVKYISGQAPVNFNGTIKAYLTYSDNKIAEHIVEVEETSIGKDIWHTYSFLVRTGSSARSTTITLSLENAGGTIYFKNVGFYKYAEAEKVDEIGETIKVSADEQFEELYKKYASIESQKTNKVAIIDYKSFNFTMHSSEKVVITTENEDGTETKDEKGYYESFSHKVEENTDDDKAETVNTVNGIVGVIDTTETEIALEGTDKLTNLKNQNSLSDTALLIYNESERYTTVSPRVTYTLDSKSFYTIELYVKTSDFNEGQGLDINIGAISVYFEDVDTTLNTDNNGYTLYRAIIRTGSSSITGLTVNFVLGTETNKVKGYALVSDINLTKLKDVEEFNTLVDSVEDTDKNTVIKNFYVEENSGNSSTTTAENDTLVVFFLVFSSLLLVVAIAIAMVAIYIKKHPRKKAVKVEAKDVSNYKAKKSKAEKEDLGKDGFV